MKKIIVILLVSLCSGCHNEHWVAPAGPNEPSEFSFSPIEVSKISFILSLGWVNPVGHTIPTDHIYFHFVHNPTDPVLPVYAPGSGVVMMILLVPVGGVNECKIWIRMNDKFVYYLDHMVADPSIQQGSTIKAGDVIGTSGISGSLDLGVIDETITLGFVNPDRYGWETLYCGKPLQYFKENMKGDLYALVDREGTEKDGKIDLDVKGKLVGNWFLDGPVKYKDGPDGWDKELSFAYDIQHPSKVLVSIGGTLGLMGKWSLPQDVPVPSDISIATGKVIYPLWSPFDPIQRGIMVVQMIDESHIKVEVFPDLTGNSADFTSNVRIYAR